MRRGSIWRTEREEEEEEECSEKKAWASIESFVSSLWANVGHICRDLLRAPDWQLEPGAGATLY
jgi:hypothetical protein